MFIDLDELVDTNVTITFVDDADLMYAVDVKQYTPGNHHYAYYQALQDFLQFAVSVSEGSGHRIELIDIRLGNGVSYDIYISGSVNISVVYGNGAVLVGHEFIVSGTGNLDFTFTEDVAFTDSGLDVTTSLDIDLLVDIDLPLGLNGRLWIPPATMFTYTSMIGWFLASSGVTEPSIYTTNSISQPLLDIFYHGLGTVGGSLEN